MVQRIEDIKWEIKKYSSQLDRNYFVLKVVLPKTFYGLLNISNGGYLDYAFQYTDIDVKRVIGSGISVIYGFSNDQSETDILKNYLNPAEFFPKDLVAFGANGGSDQICFDYRVDPLTDNPPIVYWNHEATEGRDVSFLANNFDEFLLMLKESE